MSRADYGYDAPYALAMFPAATAITGIAAIIFLVQGLGRGALTMSIYFLFFGATRAASSTARGAGSSLSGKRYLMDFISAAMSRSSTWVADAVRC